MAYLVAAPEALTTAAADVAGIGTAITEANRAAAIASVFSAHALA